MRARRCGPGLTAQPASSHNLRPSMSLRILINEADADLARRLGELLLAQGRGFDVIASHDGTAALEIVRRLHVDLLITGLETPGVGGLQLLTEIRRHLPGLKAIALAPADHPLPADVIQLMGASFVFAYPPDLRALIVAIYETVGLTPSGEVWGLQLTSFLQMLNADLKTCAVTVQAGAESGQVFLQEGELIAAECGAETGDDALYRILSWNDPRIQLDYLPFERTRNVSSGLMGLLLESQRRRDTALSDILQKRTQPRFNCLVAVDFNLAKGSYRHLIRNLSEGGAFIDSGVDIALGETIELMVFSMRRHQHCTVRGRVVRREPHGFAVQFVDPDDEQRAFLREEAG